MGHLIHLEFYKLRTVRAPRILLLISMLLIAGGVSGAALSADDMNDPTLAPAALAHAGLLSVITLVLGIMAVAGEYRNKTITDTYLSTPRRGRVIQAKLAAYALAGTVFAMLNAGVALTATKIWWTAKDVPLDLGSADIWKTVLGCAAWNIAFAVIGVGVGALIRNLTAAIATALAWGILIETIVGQLIGDLARWLPFAAGSGLGDLDISGSTITPLAQPTAALALIAYAALFATIAITTTVRRDVT
jgi:ABC-2 type transport system permease protein